MIKIVKGKYTKSSSFNIIILICRDTCIPLVILAQLAHNYHEQQTNRRGDIHVNFTSLDPVPKLSHQEGALTHYSAWA
jgi:hypothetical protein